MTKSNIIVGLTTSPRSISTIDKTVDSLKLSGWQGIHVFAEPDSPLHDNCFTKISRRKERQGAWKNWFYGLKELYETYDQPWYMMVQDDVVFCKNTYGYISSLISYPKDLGCFSIFTPRMYVGPNRWNRIDEGVKLWMAQTFCFPKHMVESMLYSNEVWKIEGDTNIDNRVGLWAKINKKGIYFHNPSLCQHIGDVSTLWTTGVSAKGKRAASNYVGDDFDCLSLLTKKAA